MGNLNLCLYSLKQSIIIITKYDLNADTEKGQIAYIIQQQVRDRQKIKT